MSSPDSTKEVPSTPTTEEKFLAKLRPTETAVRRRAFSALLRSVVAGRD